MKKLFILACIVTAQLLPAPSFTNKDDVRYRADAVAADGSVHRFYIEPQETSSLIPVPGGQFTKLRLEPASAADTGVSSGALQDASADHITIEDGHVK